MTSPHIVNQGDDYTVPVQLTENGDPDTVVSTDTVRAALIKISGAAREMIGSPITVLEATPGSAWASGLIQVVLPRALTLTLDLAKYDLEVAVDNDTIHRTWIGKAAVKVVKTHIND